MELAILLHYPEILHFRVKVVRCYFVVFFVQKGIVHAQE